MNDWRMQNRGLIPGKALHATQTDPVSQPAAYEFGTVDFFLRHKAAGA
jgi:Fe2+ transport system protein FeoA